jgi:hypothetical protein
VVEEIQARNHHEAYSIYRPVVCILLVLAYISTLKMKPANKFLQNICRLSTDSIASHPR